MTLNASASTDPDGDPLTCAWTQVLGPVVTLSAPDAKKTTFTAPKVAGDTTLEFKLTVSDGKHEANDDVTVIVNDRTPPTWTVSNNIGVNDDIVNHFDESVDPSSLALTGNLAALIKSQKWSSTTTADDTLTLTPSVDGWQSGLQGLTVSVANTSGNAATSTATFAIRLNFNDFQPASVVIGQADFSGEAANQGGTAAADTMNNRVLIWNNFPTTNFHPPDAVLGQATFAGFTANDDNQDGVKDATPSARTLNNPWGLGVYRDKLLVDDLGNQRVLVYTSN